MQKTEELLNTEKELESLKFETASNRKAVDSYKEKFAFEMKHIYGKELDMIKRGELHTLSLKKKKISILRRLFNFLFRRNRNN